MNLGDDEFKYKSRVFEIAPNTKRNQELRAKKLAEENQRKQEAEKVPYIISNIFHNIYINPSKTLLFR